MTDLPPPEWAPRPSDPPPSAFGGLPQAPAGQSAEDESDGQPLEDLGCMGCTGCWKPAAAVLVALVLIPVLAFFWFGLWIFRSIEPVVDEANYFMADMVAGDVAGAVEHTSMSDRCFGSEALLALVDALQQGQPESYNFTGGSIDGAGGRAVGEARGTVTFADGVERNTKISMVKEDGQWRVCGLNTNTPREGSF